MKKSKIFDYRCNSTWSPDPDRWYLCAKRYGHPELFHETFERMQLWYDDVKGAKTHYENTKEEESGQEKKI